MTPLSQLVQDFSAAIKIVDLRRPQAVSRRSRKSYQPGIGPFAEDQAVKMIAEEMSQRDPTRYRSIRTGVRYPESMQKCDLVIGAPPEWAIEVKMARFSGDNGKPDDTAIKDILSPFPCDRSAVIDCEKLAASGFACQKAIILYGFDDPQRSLHVAIAAFEQLASTRCRISDRVTAIFEHLVHPVHASGSVFGWEVSAK